MSTVIDKKFEFPGSILHFSPRLKFTILHMYLRINPNFEKKQLLNCKQKLKIKALQNIKEIILDIAELKIHKVSSDNVQIKEEEGKGISEKEDKLVIKFKNIVKEKTEFEVEIDYSCGYYYDNDKEGVISYKSPRSGFKFVVPDQLDQSSAFQSWTQGETIESRYWFPSIDDPQVKFTREIEVVAPDDEYFVISNGTYERKGNIWKWNESTPNPAYLTSVVIGKFSRQKGEFSRQDASNRKVPLEYYWPTNIPKNYDPMLTFGETPQIIKFFENYLDTEYPYEKYWQVAVNKFEFGGMENTSCTTLTPNILHDDRASLDYSRDIIIVAHELAHQWFGDLITCKDWPHIWLNEGFANYFETLYWGHKHQSKYENKKTNDEFLYKIIETIEDYIDEANSLYKRPIVTNLYKHPDELFDSHSYEKGGLVLYMLSNLMGEEHFKKAIKKYLDTYRDSTAKTEDFQKVCEAIDGEDLQQFFHQWLYTAGHPELEIQFSLAVEEKSHDEVKQIKKIKIKISQVQKEGFEFSFPLEVRIVCNDKKDEKKIKIDEIENIEISKKDTDYTLKKEIPTDATIKWISIDPNLKILKEIKSVSIVNQEERFNLIDILNNQLDSDITTIAEKIGSLQLLKDCYSKKTVELLKNVILTDPFYGVAVEAANVLGLYHDKKNYTKDNDAYDALEKCLTDEKFTNLAPQTKRAIISNIGLFERESTLELKNNQNLPLLVSLLDDKSYFLENAAATTIGKCIKNLPNEKQIKKEKMIQVLKDKVVNSITFQDQLAQGAINGLRELANDENVDIVQDIAELLIRKSSKLDHEANNIANSYFIRSAATLALGKFLLTQNEQVLNDKIKKEKIDKISKSILDHLLTLLKDERQRIKNNACTALADKDAKITEPNERITKSIGALRSVAEEDIDGFVRRTAEVNLNLIRSWLKEWTDTPPTLEIKIRKELAGVSKIKEEKIRKGETKEKEEKKEKEGEERKYEKIQRAARKERLEY